jgi:hypothetical protein
MSKPADPPDDELRQLLRDATGAAPAANPSRAAHPAKSSESSDLRAVLREGSSAALSPHPREVRPGAAPPGASIQELLRSSPADADKPPATRRESAAVPPKTALSLDQVLREVRSGPVTAEAPPRTAPVPRRTGSAELGQVLRDRPVNPELDAAKASRTNVAASPWFARAGWAIALLLVIGIVFWWPKQPLEGSAGVLQSLAKAVEQHRSKTGSLPEQLSGLEGFPKDAVEWPAKYWNARDAVGRMEILWIPNGSRHYRIVLRQGAEVWIFNDKEGKSRLVTQ